MIGDKTKLTDVEQIDANLPLKKVNGKDIIGAPQAALTAQSGIPTGTDAGTIANIITRVGELETRLRALGLLQ